ncbi:MAG: PQQ-binding-like beta-propeller repeat protein [Sedimentisphaerales bacterium]|nr:PQQ-binding-like beta-propeller repeat protein [Sedimentisphaerales bacterium]
MKSRKIFLGLLVAVVSQISCWMAADALGDWPQWRGGDRDGICTETGLLSAWPADGPKLLWEMNGLGTGYSGVAIVNGTLYTLGDIDTADGKAQCIIAIDPSSRNILWTARVGSPHEDGPRCTPTIDDGCAYAVGTGGDVVCVEIKTGRELWRKHLQRDLGGGSNPGWKFSESPLIDGDKLVCTPGGRRSVMAALHKKTGQVLWQAAMPDIGNRGKDEAGYSSIVISRAAGIKQYVQLTNKGCLGVDAEAGRFLWGYNRIANRVANVPTPVVWDDYVFCSTAYGTGSALLQIGRQADQVTAQELYFLGADDFQNHHGGFVKVGDFLYGGHGHNQGAPTCLEIKTGKIRWKAAQPGGGSAGVLYADGHLIFRYQDGSVALVEASPEAYRQTGFFRTPDRPGARGESWSHPVIDAGRLYLRHGDVLFCYDVKAP